MNSKAREVVFWGAIITPIILAVFFLLWRINFFMAGPHGSALRGMEVGRDFRGHHAMYAPHHDGFSWIGFLFVLFIGVAVVVFFTKWVRKKANASSVQQFIDTSIMSSHKPSMNQNGALLDQWEKNISNKKENE